MSWINTNTQVNVRMWRAPFHKQRAHVRVGTRPARRSARQVDGVPRHDKHRVPLVRDPRARDRPLHAAKGVARRAHAEQWRLLSKALEQPPRASLLRVSPETSRTRSTVAPDAARPTMHTKPRASRYPHA